jgi:hypothetical protein
MLNTEFSFVTKSRLWSTRAGLESLIISLRRVLQLQGPKPRVTKGAKPTLADYHY